MTTFVLTHEANNLSEYTATTETGAGSVSTSVASAMGGTNFGLQSSIAASSDRAFAYLDFAAFGGTQYSVSFWFDPNSITMPVVNPPNFAQPDIVMFRLRKGAGAGALVVEMQWDGTNYRLLARLRDDNDSLIQVASSIALSDAAHFIEITVIKATNTTSNDGEFSVEIDSVVEASRTDIDIFDKFTDPSRIEIGIDDGEGTMSGVCYWDQITGLFGVTPSSGNRPLELDMDLEDGSKKWVTYWNEGSLNLRNYSDAFVIGSTSILASGTTIAEIDNRTYYASPYSPGFFGTPNLGNIIYVFGRWDDGTVRHLQKSTDSGSSFSDIGDSATWTTGWVGGFFADDANTLYAFVNGGSRALYRSTNAGSTWTNLSSLPFDVDPGGVSKHPDGRILISNRDAGGQTAAYAVGPDYSSWIDATGSPSFPTSTPGNGSNSVIWVT